MKRLGPDLKVPDFVVDLYYDLRDRRLLPLVALAIVAIVAVPFLLSGGGESEPEPAPSAEAGASISGVDSAKLTVVEAKPGLRDYRKRLRGRRPTDPFEQRYTAPVLNGTELGADGEGSESSGSTETSTSVTRTSTSVTKTTKTTAGDTTKTTTTTTTDPTADGAQEPQLTLFSFAIDAKIVRISSTAEGGKEKQTSTRHRIVPPAALPNEQSQVVTYMGISPKTRKPLLLVSTDVTGVFGEAECLSGSEACQLLEVDVGFPVTFVHGPDGVRYKINVLKVEPVVAGEAPASPE